MKECTFRPDVLNPGRHDEYDPNFYDRQLEWYENVIENNEFTKEKLFEQNHREVPQAFTSPFVDRDEIPQSVYHVNNLLGNTSYQSLDDRPSMRSQTHLSMEQKTKDMKNGELQNFLNKELMDAQQIFNRLNMMFDTKKQSVNISIDHH